MTLIELCQPATWVQRKPTTGLLGNITSREFNMMYVNTTTVTRNARTTECREILGRHLGGLYEILQEQGLVYTPGGIPIPIFQLGGAQANSFT